MDLEWIIAAVNRVKVALAALMRNINTTARLVVHSVVLVHSEGIHRMIASTDSKNKKELDR